MRKKIRFFIEMLNDLHYYKVYCLSFIVYRQTERQVDRQTDFGICYSLFKDRQTDKDLDTGSPV